MTTEHLIGIGDERPRETEVTHCARGQIYLDMKYSAPAAMLYPQAALDAAVAAERERWRGALLLMRGRLLMENPHALTAEVDELLLATDKETQR